MLPQRNTVTRLNFEYNQLQIRTPNWSLVKFIFKFCKIISLSSFVMIWKQWVLKELVKIKYCKRVT